MPEKAKKDNPLRRFILKKTGAKKVVEGLENKPEKKNKSAPKDTAGMTRMRIPAGMKKKSERKS